jgi:hypothetical protein
MDEKANPCDIIRLNRRGKQLRKTLDEFYQEALAVAKDCGLPFGNITKVTMTTATPNIWGRCKVINHGESYRLEFNKGVILRSDERFVIQTMLHEIIHTCPQCLGHTGNFKRYAAIIKGKYPQYNIKRTNGLAEAGYIHDPNDYKYALKCEKCGNVIVVGNRMTETIRKAKLLRHKVDGGRVIRIK